MRAHGVFRRSIRWPGKIKAGWVSTASCPTRTCCRLYWPAVTRTSARLLNGYTVGDKPSTCILTG